MSDRTPIRNGLFKEGPNGGTLLGSKCKTCGQVFFPPAGLCLECGHEELAEVELGRRGTLYSYTIGHMPSFHFMPPYALGLIDLPEGVRVFAPLVMPEDASFEIGMGMDLIIEKLWDADDKEVIGYKFKPA